MQLATNLAPDTLGQIAKKLGLKLIGFKETGQTRNGKSKYDFTLAPTSDKYRKLGYTGRRVAAASFAGYTQFMKNTFKKDGAAEFKTMYGKINSDNISAMEYEVGSRNIGSVMSPMLYEEAEYSKEAAERRKKLYA